MQAGSTEDEQKEGEHNENKDTTEQNPDTYQAEAFYIASKLITALETF